MHQSSGDDRVDLFRLLVVLGIRMRSRMDRRLAEVSLTTQQAAVLTTVETADQPPSVADVSRFLGTTHQNTRQIVEALERKGLMVIEPDDNDRRRRLLYLSPAVAERFRDREAGDRQAVAEWTAALDDQQVRTAVRLLDQLAHPTKDVDSEDDSRAL